MQPTRLDHLPRLWALSKEQLSSTLVIGPDVVTDSRLATDGAVFVALEGEHVDGHSFVPQAAKAGASLALVSREQNADIAQLECEPIKALAALASDVVADAVAHGMQICAITGSVGKTSTKDMLGHILTAHGETVVPPGSFNNDIGAPITACRVRPSTRYLIAEMGARGIGHIQRLCEITPPHVSVLLNVGSAHLGEFGSKEALHQAKTEIFAGLGPDDWAVLNADDPLVNAWEGSAKTARFSMFQPPAADISVWAEHLRPGGEQRHEFDLCVARNGETECYRVSLQIPGSHMVGNALAAATAALCLGVPASLIATRLSDLTQVSARRMQLVERNDGAFVLNDSYNANPDSMRAGIATAAALACETGGRLIAICGDMLELGEAAASAHAEVGARLASAGASFYVAVGEYGPEIARGAVGIDGAVVASADEVVATLPKLRKGDVILVKASLALALGAVAERLSTTGATQPTGDNS